MSLHSDFNLQLSPYRQYGQFDSYLLTKNKDYLYNYSQGLEEVHFFKIFLLCLLIQILKLDILIVIDQFMMFWDIVQG